MKRVWTYPERGEEIRAAEPLTRMTDHQKKPDALDEFVSRLLDCGGVLSQMIASMVEFDATAGPVPGTAEIPAVAASLIRSVISSVGERYSQAQIATASDLIEEVTAAVCNDIFLVRPDMN